MAVNINTDTLGLLCDWTPEKQQDKEKLSFQEQHEMHHKYVQYFLC